MGPWNTDFFFVVPPAGPPELRQGPPKRSCRNDVQCLQKSMLFVCLRGQRIGVQDPIDPGTQPRTVERYQEPKKKKKEEWWQQQEKDSTKTKLELAHTVSRLSILMLLKLAPTTCWKIVKLRNTCLAPPALRLTQRLFGGFNS